MSRLGDAIRNGSIGRGQCTRVLVTGQGEMQRVCALGAAFTGTYHVPPPGPDLYSTVVSFNSGSVDAQPVSAEHIPSLMLMGYSGHKYGEYSLAGRLLIDAYPELLTNVSGCPAPPKMYLQCSTAILPQLIGMIIHLNDYHQWTFTEIAQWVDGVLDLAQGNDLLLDMSMPLEVPHAQRQPA